MFQVTEIVSYGVQEWSVNNERERMGKVKVVALVMLPPQCVPELSVEMPHKVWVRKSQPVGRDLKLGHFDWVWGANHLPAVFMQGIRIES